MKKVKKKEGCAKQCLASSQVYCQVYRGYGELFPCVLSSHSLVELRLSSIEEPCVLREYSYIAFSFVLRRYIHLTERVFQCIVRTASGKCVLFWYLQLTVSSKKKSTSFLPLGVSSFLVRCSFGVVNYLKKRSVQSFGPWDFSIVS